MYGHGFYGNGYGNGYSYGCIYDNGYGNGYGTLEIRHDGDELPRDGLHCLLGICFQRIDDVKVVIFLRHAATATWTAGCTLGRNCAISLWLT